MNRYNGWSNKETWLLNLWYSEVIIELIDERGYQSPEDIKDFMEVVLHDCEPLDSLPRGLYMDFINDAFNEIDWYELASTYNQQEK